MMQGKPDRRLTAKLCSPAPRNTLKSSLLPTLLIMVTVLHTAWGLKLASSFLKETGIGMCGWRGRWQGAAAEDEQERRAWRQPGVGWGKLLNRSQGNDE